MGDTISRQAVITEINSMPTITDENGEKLIDKTCLKLKIKALPPAQPALYGYDLKNLIIFADAVRKKKITESEIEDFVRNARAAWEYAWEEFQRTQKEALDSIMRGDRYEE